MLRKRVAASEARLRPAGAELARDRGGCSNRHSGEGSSGTAAAPAATARRAAACRTAPAALLTVLLTALAVFVGLAVLPGCGEQDLYKPPKSPYQVIARVAMPSACEDVSVLGEHAYVAGGQAGIHVVDLTNPYQARIVRSLNTTKFAEAVKVASTPTGNGVVDIAFVVEGTEGITTYNCDLPDSTWSFNQGTTAVDGNGMFVEIPDYPSDRYTVFLAESWKGLRIFESDPAYPGVLRYNGVFAGTSGYAKSVVVKDGFAYVADDEMGVSVLDVRVRVLGAVRVVSTCDTEGNAKGIEVRGDYAFVADGKNGLVVMKIDGGEPPVIVGRLLVAGDCRAIAIRDEFVFLAAQDGGIHVVDASNPADPKLAGTVVTPYATGVSVSDRGLLVASDRTQGLIVLGGPSAFRDEIAPAAVSNLRVEMPIGRGLARLRWTATGNDLFHGTAASYDIRYSQAPITEANWDSCSACVGEPPPAKSGSAERYSVRGLEQGEAYYFALKGMDGSSNVSRLSNVATAITSTEDQPPVVTTPVVSPTGGETGTVFTFRILYTDVDGEGPDRAELVMFGPGFPSGGQVIDLSVEEENFEDGVLYTGSVTLTQLGVYRHRFQFVQGSLSPIVTDEIAGPLVGAQAFVMGSPPNEPGRDVDEDQRTMVLPWNVEISDHEVTQAEYVALMGDNPSRFGGSNLPVERVSWYDALEYCNRLSTDQGLTPVYTIQGESVTWDREADGYRLPTEAEWEWACRADVSTAFAGGAISILTCRSLAGDPDPVLDTMGWYCGNSSNRTHPVMTKEPNALGMYDMHGNVWEWCWDRYSVEGPRPDLPFGAETGGQRVIRGGSWYYFARDCRSASRAPYWPNSADDVVGFRVARTLRD